MVLIIAQTSKNTATTVHDHHTNISCPYDEMGVKILIFNYNSCSRYRPCRLSLQKECSLIRHAPAVGQARTTIITAYLIQIILYTVKEIFLEYQVDFTSAVARHSRSSQGFLCDESVASGAGWEIACFSNASSCLGCGKARRLPT